MKLEWPPPQWTRDQTPLSLFVTGMAIGVLLLLFLVVFC